MIAYQNTLAENNEDRDQMVRDHCELVRRIAYHLIARLPDSTDVEDLIQAGMIGLLEAAKSYDPTRGASFATFAGIRIRGSMIDEVRRHDWTPRSVHQKHRKVLQAFAEIEAETGRHAEGPEVAARLDISIDEYHKILRDSAVSKLASLDETFDNSTQVRQVPNEKSPQPDAELDREQFRGELASALEHLPEREQMVLSLYYEQELNLKEIGVILGVSESRVCQVHGQAVARLRSRMVN